MSYIFKLTSSMEKVFFDRPDHIKEISSATMLKNETYSFQIVAWFEENNNIHEPIKFVVDSDIKDCVCIYREGYVAANTPRPLGLCDDDYLFTTPQIVPDPLFELDDNNGDIFKEQTRAFWVTICPDKKYVGEHDIKIKVMKESGEELSELIFKVDILDLCLPEQELICSRWFHGDCIASLHNTSVFTEEYWSLVDKYMKVFKEIGHNMILTPVVTPPLDTQIGGERPTNQLVDIYLDNGVYSFNFDKLKRWIDLSLSNGIKYFEISHFFTQWGAKFTPKVIACVDGKTQRIFGWDVESNTDEYKSFLAALMPALVEKLKEYNVFEKCYFHISDEPMPEHKEQYLLCKNIMLQYLPESQLIDALADYGFYEEGIVKKPVVSNDHIAHFMDHDVENLWTYYCVCQGNKVSNSFMAMPSYRNRVLGLQIYKNDIEGFLQWGFNFWYSKLSKTVIDPYMVTDSLGFVSGDAYLVYPVDTKGNVVRSLRSYIFAEGLQDLRALKLLESYTDKEYVLAFLKDIYRFTDYPRNNEYYIELREKINSELKKHI